MWAYIASRILRNRVAILIVIGIITVFMAYQSQYVELTYKAAKLLPDNDSTYIIYENFRKQYGEDGNVIVLGIGEDLFDDVEQFNAWYDLGHQLEVIEGIDTIISIANIYNVVKNSSEKKFMLEPVISSRIASQKELDSLKVIVFSLPFYGKLLYNDTSKATLMAITVNNKIFSSKSRIVLLKQMMDIVEAFTKKNNLQVHYSGLPFIRTKISEMLKQELKMFIVLALLVTVIILFFFFRSFKAVSVSMLVVAIGVVWSLGTMALLKFEITVLTSLIPPLIIVIGVPNCIFLLNKYHSEFKIHGNKIKALSRVIQKIGNATFMTNATTAIGFATFIFIASPILKEFGVIASISIMLVFALSLCILPIMFSFLSSPKQRHVKHLEKKWIGGLIELLVHSVINYRNTIYITTVVLVLICIYGISRIKITGNVVDDIPKTHSVYKDLKFFEKHFHGVMPFEIIIDTKKPNYAIKLSTLDKIDKLQHIFADYPEFSRPMSIVEAVKFSKQAYYNGNPMKYQLISNSEKVFFKPYIDNAKNSEDLLHSFMDSTKQNTRVSVQMADIGIEQMDALINAIRPRIDSVLPPDKFNISLTGSSVVFLKGTTYLIRNLFKSLFLAIVLIALIMALLFSSIRMVIVSLIPNLIPLLFTAALMGFFGIAIKPSTILVFSIAFGISVDDTIHYLAKYRQELKLNDWDIKTSAIVALRETGISMTYTSIVLFFGFAMFIASDFGGTMALGLLVSITLFIAMLSNLILLPSLLLTLDKAITTRAFKEPFLQILDEDDDIEIDKLVMPNVK